MASVKGSTPLWLICWEHYPQRRSKSGRMELWSMLITALGTQLTVQPLLSHVLEATLSSSRYCHWSDTPNYDCTRYNLIHAENEGSCQMGSEEGWDLPSKEAECHKCNYDKCSRAAALGDTFLVHVTAFKGHHRIQDRWKNREYVVKKWPFPNVPVYVVCFRDGEGCSQTLHRNYLLPINSNIV